MPNFTTVQNILNDIIVHASTQEEHDKRLENVLSVLQNKGITLKRASIECKCGETVKTIYSYGST